MNVLIDRNLSKKEALKILISLERHLYFNPQQNIAHLSGILLFVNFRETLLSSKQNLPLLYSKVLTHMYEDTTSGLISNPVSSILKIDEINELIRDGIKLSPVLSKIKNLKKTSFNLPLIIQIGKRANLFQPMEEFAKELTGIKSERMIKGIINAKDPINFLFWANAFKKLFVIPNKSDFSLNLLELLSNQEQIISPPRFQDLSVISNNIVSFFYKAFTPEQNYKLFTDIFKEELFQPQSNFFNFNYKQAQSDKFLSSIKEQKFSNLNSFKKLMIFANKAKNLSLTEQTLVQPELSRIHNKKFLNYTIYVPKKNIELYQSGLDLGNCLFEGNKSFTDSINTKDSFFLLLKEGNKTKFAVNFDSRNILEFGGRAGHVPQSLEKEFNKFLKKNGFLTFSRQEYQKRHRFLFKLEPKIMSIYKKASTEERITLKIIETFLETGDPNILFMHFPSPEDWSNALKNISLYLNKNNP